MARGNKKGQAKVSALGPKKGRVYDADAIGVNTNEGDNQMPSRETLDQMAKYHEGTYGSLAKIDATADTPGARIKFIAGLDLQKKSDRSALRDLIARDIGKDPMIQKNAVGMTVRSYKNDFLERIPGGLEVYIKTSPEHAEAVESRVEHLINAYRTDIKGGNTNFEATISTRNPDDSRINDKFI
jgi:hypothetical protein